LVDDIDDILRVAAQQRQDSGIDSIHEERYDPSSKKGGSYSPEFECGL
jgi:hypothetical protein